MDFKTENQPINSKFVQTCEIPDEDEKEIEPFTMVIFGGAGDLFSRKLLPTLSHLYREKELKCNFSILGVDMNEMGDDTYRKFLIETLHKFGSEEDSTTESEFLNRFFYFSMNLTSSESYRSLMGKLSDVAIPDSKSNKNIIYYMAVPPFLTPVIVENIKDVKNIVDNLNDRILVEKPFGSDRKTAGELNSVLLDVFKEDQIYRLDHYLGKETVQNLIFFRFSNSIFEPLWNRRYIDNVQITVAESLGIEHRGKFYEKAGVVRDIIQNHMMQLIALVAMEPPVGFEADFVRDEKVKIFNTIRPMDIDYLRDNTFQGQYGTGIVDGSEVNRYRDEPDVNKNSITPTFIAAKLHIDNWRWAGVPFYIRSGKRMAKRITEICIQFKQPPLKLFGRSCDNLDPNVMRITIQPREEITMKFGIKYPNVKNMIYHVNMNFSYEKTFNIGNHPPYERLILDCMRSDLTLFARQDGIDAMWRVVDPIIEYWDLNPHDDFPNYDAGTWGPPESDELLNSAGHRWITQ